MVKRLKFVSELVPLVLNRTKYATWRINDDKDLQVGDVVEFFELGKEVPFAEVKINRILEKEFGLLTKDDKKGHESYESETEMFDTFSRYYNVNVTSKTMVKICWFELQ